MSFFKGVSTDAAADPLTVSNLTDVIGYIFANPNGVVSRVPAPPALGSATTSS
jgi:hypothetical protein